MIFSIMSFPHSIMLFLPSFMSFPQSIVVWIPDRHCERLQGAWQSSKNNKKILIYRIFYWIASSKLAVSSRNRHLSKFAYREEFKGDTSPRTAAYTSVREDSSTGSTYLPLEAKFRKMSNDDGE
ncbi:palindromic element RPE1 domain-containing protein [Rickettsia tamurae]|uniref:palindromic element RPE1 domain-containing protein n=1 Tax=Rickettsia tamurae TaxID=334545 RepID=UPI00050A1EB0|nr:palindromic element RPE1 domain-containing protein [Rickettsia tamurae]